MNKEELLKEEKSIKDKSSKLLRERKAIAQRYKYYLDKYLLMDKNNIDAINLKKKLDEMKERALEITSIVEKNNEDIKIIKNKLAV